MPGDKSISHRAAIMAALADGRTHIENFSTSQDCATTLSCLAALGVNILQDGTHVEIEGVGLDGLRKPTAPLDCGNSGSTMRMLAGILASQKFASELTGDESLLNRPMNRIVKPLSDMGARIESTDGHAPMRIYGRSPLDSISYNLPIASAQIKTCILFAGLNADGRTEVIEPLNSTRDHTERMLKWLGCPVTTRVERRDGRNLQSISIVGPRLLEARDGVVPGDISSAACFIVAAAILHNSRLKIYDVGFNPTRTSIIPTIVELGAQVFAIPDVIRFGTEDYGEPIGKVEVTGGIGPPPFLARRSNILCGIDIPQLIDELPIIAILGTQLPGGLSIRDAGELRVKESDRISATVQNLRAMGATVDEHDDGMTIKGNVKLSGARINSFGDHRIAMAFSIAALIANGESEILGSECVRVSFPEFYEMLESVVKR
jgi:3-phosphoshikimate 1-carboxyvinyltransferase